MIPAGTCFIRFCRVPVGFAHIIQVYFMRSDRIIRLPHWQGSNPDNMYQITIYIYLTIGYHHNEGKRNITVIIFYGLCYIFAIMKTKSPPKNIVNPWLTFSSTVFTGLELGRHCLCWCIRSSIGTVMVVIFNDSCRPGPRLNIKTVFPRYGDSHVKDKTVGEAVLSLTWESLYW